jgi:hypothetical protein
MKAFIESGPAPAGPKLASSFSLSEKLAVPLARGDPDEHSQTGILTSGFGLTPAFPVA